MNAQVFEDLSKSLKGAVEGITSLNERFELQMKAHSERFDKLEGQIREKLIKEGGAKELPKRKWAWSRFCLAIATKEWRYAPFEKEECEKYQQELEKRQISQTMTADNFAGGGSLIPPQYVAELIELLRPALILQSLGVTVLDGLVGSPIIYPKQTSGSTAYWIAPEGTSITASDLGTGNLEMRPHALAALVKLSRTLVMLGNPSVEALVRADLVRTMSQEIDRAAFQGTGVSGQPLGMKNQTPVIPDAGAFNGADAEVLTKSIQNLIKTVENNEGLFGNLSFACTPASYWTIAQAFDTTKRLAIQPQAQSSISTPLPTDWFGFPVRRSTLVDITTGATSDSHNVYFGNWSDFILSMWATMEIAASAEADTAFKNNELWIRAISYVDYGVRREKSFSKEKDVE